MSSNPGIYFVVAVLLLSLAYEFFALITKRQLITTAIGKMIKGRPFIPFLAGFLCGHFFW